MNSNLIIEHKLPLPLKTLIYDSIYNQHSRTAFTQSQYLLQINPKQQAEVYFFDSSLTSITNNLKIKHLSDPRCFVLSHKPERYKIVAYSNAEILIYGAKVDQFGNFKQDFEEFKFPIKLQKNEQIIYISSPITLANIEAYIAYTNQDEFYLLQTHIQQGDYRLEFAKLIDLDESKGIFGWFARKEKQHYTSIKLQLVALQTGEQSIRVVSIRDYEIMVHLVQVKPQNSTIKVIQKLNTLSSIINNGCTLVGIVLLENEGKELQQFSKDHVLKFIGIFQDNQKKHLVSIQIFISQTQVLPLCKLIQRFDVSFHFQIISYFNTYFIKWFNQNTNAHTLTLLPLQDILKISKQLLLQTKPYIQQDDQIFLCKGNRQVFILANSTIYRYEPFELQNQSSFSIKYVTNLKNQIHKPAQLNEYQEILHIVKKVEENFKEAGLKSNDYCKQYLCTFILRRILESQSLHLLQNYILQSSNYKENEQNILSQACKQTDQQHIKALVDFISHTKLFRVLIEQILCETARQFCQTPLSQLSSSAKIYYQSLIFLFDDSMNYALKQLHSHIWQNNENLRLYQLLINSFVSFKEIQISNLQPLLNTNQEKFIKDIIVNNKKTQLFIHFFSKTKLQFDYSDIKELCLNAFENNEDASSFIKQLLTECRSQFKKLQGSLPKSEFLKIVRRKIQALIKGLQGYTQLLLFHIQHIYPGLSVYFYLKQDRKGRVEKLLQLAKKCQKPETSYVLNLAVGVDDGKQVLDNNRLCHQLKLGNISTEMLVSQLNNGNFNDIEVNRRTWESWKQSCQGLQKQFVQMEKKLQLVDKEKV